MREICAKAPRGLMRPVLTYTPDPNYLGTDSFTFIANDGEDDSNVATVSITVTEIIPESPVVY